MIWGKPAFYCTTASLRTEGIITESHSRTLSKFGELFIKTNRIDTRYSSVLLKALDFRQSCDYDIEVTLSDEDAKLLFSYATEFYELNKHYLKLLNK